jgi:nicotinate phosphoribosyltransferase
VARALGKRLWGVRLDTSGQLVDRSLWGEMGDFDPRGVNERLVRKVRDALDRDGFEHVKIVVSGGFTAERIAAFEERGVPVDSYGVGSALIRGENDFTADIVMTDGRPSAKVGPPLPREPAARARRLAADRRRDPGQLSIGSVERTMCMPAAAKRAKAASASSV